MNIKITKKEHERLCQVSYEEYLFGSRLFGTHTEKSDYDYIRVYDYFDNFDSKCDWLPNIHSFQVDLDGVQYIWMTKEQFWRGLSSGDGTIQSDILMYSGKFDKEFALNMCSRYNVIKAYLGVGKRDLKLHNTDKKRFHAHRSIYTAQQLLKGEVPTLEVIREISNNLGTKLELNNWCSSLRKILNSRYDKGEIVRYHIESKRDTLLDKMERANNIKEFKYD